MTQQEEVLDMGVITALRELDDGGGQGLFRELLDLYVDDSTKLMQRLEQALAGGDLKSAERIAHTLKSSSANLGATAVSRLCREIEVHGREQALDRMTALLPAARAAHQDAIQALNALRS